MENKSRTVGNWNRGGQIQTAGGCRRDWKASGFVTDSGDGRRCLYEVGGCARQRTGQVEMMLQPGALAPASDPASAGVGQRNGVNACRNEPS